MARIRTVKPQFFRHEHLFDSEIETGLPLRVAFIGLWTICDREGRFEWRPRSMKMDVLPYDDVSFPCVLDELMRRGFIVKYEVEGKEYGCIPSWGLHQVINGRERHSLIPDMSEGIVIEPESTREPRVTHASPTRHVHAHGEGKGREGKRKGREGEQEHACLTTHDQNDVCKVSEAMSIYNEAAQRVGWPQAQRETPARKSSISARFKEAGGIEGWRIAVQKASQSGFLTGRSSGSVKFFSIDWMSKQSNFTKIMEGNYDDKNSSSNPPRDPRQVAADNAYEERVAFASRNRSPSSGDIDFG